MSISWSKKFLLQISFHSHLSSTKSLMELIEEVCWLLIKYKVRYFAWRFKLSPSHLSFHKLILVPQPTLHLRLSIKQLLCYCWKTAFKSCHHWDENLLFPSKISSFHPPYLESKILTQGWFWLLASSHPHLPSKASLKLDKSLIPRPPLFLGRQTVSHFTQGILLASWWPPQRKFLSMETMLCTTFMGILKKDSK